MGPPSSAPVPPVMWDCSSSVCRAKKQLYKGTSGFRRILFFLQVLPIASFHSAAFLPLQPSMHANGVGLGCLVVGCGLTAECTRNQLSKLFQPVWCYTAFPSPPAAQPPAAGGPHPGHTFVPDTHERSSAMPCSGWITMATPGSSALSTVLLVTVLPGAALCGSGREMSLLLILPMLCQLFSWSWWVSVSTRVSPSQEITSKTHGRFPVWKKVGKMTLMLY